MSTKKSKTNGAVEAPVPAIFEEAAIPPTKKSNGKSANSPIKKIPADLDGSIDQRQLLAVLAEVKNGNFSVRVPNDQVGVTGKIYDTLNDIISLNEILVQELAQARKIIGKQGKLNHRVELPRLAGGSWSTAVDSINSLISDLVHPTIEIAHVISSVAKGNLSQEMPLQIGDHLLQGEFARIASEVNDMVKQLNLFSMEVTRVAREVGSEGKLGGQA
ncbi:MAG TPA: HAMP domain-containing protein, partial [Flavisolibacter sp.]|nr:HAMP domain-containing protein [Flavisolibacter sp.]